MAEGGVLGEAKNGVGDELPEARSGRRDWSHMVRFVALDAFRMAQHVVPCETFWRLARGPRHAGQNFTPGLMRRLTLHVGHLTLASLTLFSSAIGMNPSGNVIRHVGRMASPPWASFPKRGAGREEP
jgi:hypothetical protein